MKDRKKLFILISILLTAIYLRFYNLMHDAPYFFNPDERNMANAITLFRIPAKISEIPICLISQIGRNPTANYQLPTNNCNLNPHFFAYGQFPLYLAFASDQFSQIPIRLINQIGLISNQQSTTHNLQLTTNFPSAIFWLRFYSAISSILTVLIVFLISCKLLTLRFALLTTMLVAFTPGLIQSAHFGTTESLLTFFFMASIYLAISYLSRLSHLKFILFSSLTIGLAIGSKLTGIFFIVPPVASLTVRTIELFKLRKKKLWIDLFDNLKIACLTARQGLFLIISSIIVFILSSPYNLVEPESFKSAVFGYESDVATGKYEAFYTKQFAGSIPILFQAEKIFPYALGWPVFILGTIGFIILTIKLFLWFILTILLKSQKSKVLPRRQTGKSQNYNVKLKILNFQLNFCILLFAFLIYFISNAFLFAKWTRFMTPILPFFAIFSGYLLSTLLSSRSQWRNFSLPFVGRFLDSLRSLGMTLLLRDSSTSLRSTRNDRINKLGYLPAGKAGVIGLLVFIGSITPGLAFMSIYTHEDSRVTASKWIYQNITNNSYILSETANVVDIPLGLPSTTNYQPPTTNYTVISFDFYHLDENPLLFTQLINHLEIADYIFIPSRRIFANYTRFPFRYPLITKYYQLLFSGTLGYEKVKEISSFPQLPIGQIGPISLIGNDENAEETFTVFDHPVIRIYKKVKPFTKDEYKSLFEK